MMEGCGEGRDPAIRLDTRGLARKARVIFLAYFLPTYSPLGCSGKENDAYVMRQWSSR